MSDAGSITHWIAQLKAGDRAAVQQLWERYFLRLVRLARKNLRGQARVAADEEDVALSAFTRFCLGAERGQFPKLTDRDDLWQLLVVITSNRAIDHIRHERRKKRDAAEVVSISAESSGSSESGSLLAQLVDPEPTPEFAAIAAEEFRRLLEQLPDDTLRTIALLKMEGFTAEEIAAKLDRTVRTIERKMNRIRLIWSAELK